MNRQLLFSVVLAGVTLAVAADVRAASQLTVSKKDCARIVRYAPSADVAYKPGVDAYGRKVAPADLGGGSALKLPKEITIDIGIDLEIGITRGIYLPKGTPPAIVTKLTQIVEKAAKSETFAKFGKTYGFAPLWINGADFEKMIRTELDTNRKIKAKYIDK